MHLHFGSGISIHLREKQKYIRLRDRAAASRLRKLAGKDIRFSMKMMLMPESCASLQPV
jgi:hypothetical protein